MQTNNKQILLLLNPVAGKGKGKERLFEIIDRLYSHGYQVTAIPTDIDGKANLILQNEWHNYSKLVCVGGDGTLSGAVNAYIAGNCEIPMGYIPLGSTNDFAATLGISKKLLDACDRIAESEPKFIDVGKFNDRYFSYIACTGLLTEVSYMTSQQLKNMLGHNAYLLKGVFALKNAKKIRYTVKTDSETIEGDYLFASVSNTEKAGGVFKFPKGEIQLDDGYFELTLLKAPNGIYEMTTLINDLINGKVKGSSFVKRKVRHATIEINQPRGWSLDGENGGMTQSANISVVENKLLFL